MTFKDLSALIAEQRLDSYYEILLDNAETIITEIGNTSKKEVAEHLQIHPTVFSTVYKLIKAEYNRSVR